MKQVTTELVTDYIDAIMDDYVDFQVESKD